MTTTQVKEVAMSRKAIPLVVLGLFLLSLAGRPPAVAGTAPPAGDAVTGPRLWVTPLSLGFGPVGVGFTAPTQVVTITNYGDATLTNFAGGGVSLPFHGSQDCAAGVAPGGHCHYYFTFSPTAGGTFTTTSNSSTNAGPFSIALQGRGRTSLFSSGQRVTPRSLDFGPVGVGFESGPLVVTITNQYWFVTLTNWSGGGLYPPFNASQDCANGVPPGGHCHYYFRFSPTETGTFSATSTSSNSGGTFSIDVRGTGVGASLYVTPLWLDFGLVQPGNTSPVQTATIYNTGMSTLTNFAGGGLYPPFLASQDCANGVPPGEHCRYYFRFAPSRLGRFTAYSTSGTNGGSFTVKVQGGELRPVFLPLVMK
jgi:hypothetical protein